MQVKFETKSARVKGLSFHPNRPWILASLHDGEIQLWDYRLGTLIEKFIEHEGPVRGINFHQTQPLFVSGGDDTKIIGWNYRTKAKAFILKGHLDFVRTVSFHHQLPWVLSASDDYTCKIWNYVSRTCLYTMCGHANLVMCAQFHPRNDLIISCSLDFTLRLWDFTNLRKKYTTADAKEKQYEAGINGHEVEVKAIIDAHDRGVNWCAFHPTGNLIASAGDDNKVKLWKFSEGTGKVTEHDVLYGHNKNVSCVLFHERLDVIITNSEDKTMRVWDLYSKKSVDTFTKGDGRYWTLASHPQVNYVAAGHDTGFSVFTLQSERISSVLAPNQQDLFYVYKKQLFHKDCRNGRETLIKDIDHTPTGSSLCYQQPSAIYYNQFNNTSNNVLIQFKDKEKIYHKYYLYTFDSNIARAKNECNSTFRYCLGAVFVAKDRLAILSNSKEVGLLDNSGNIKNLANLPLIDMIYPAHMGKIIMRSDTAAILYDTTTRKLINQIDYTDIQHLKRVVWTNKYTHVALLCKKTVYILNKNFNLLTTINEQFKVSSAVWNTDGVLIYTTKTHLKYSLVNGDQGIIKSLETPIYLAQASGNEIIAIDSEARFQKFSIDREEYLFKLAIRSRNAAKIEACLKNHNKLGNSLISYLVKKNHSAIALHMVDDLKARFSLAIDSGNLEVAFETCHDQLKDKESYTILSEEALRQGNHQIMEIAYQKNRSYEKLSFLYLVTGNIPKLEKMMGIAQKRGDIMSRFQNALFLGDVNERVRILAEAGLVHLAYLTAVNHGLQDMVAPLAQAIEDSMPSLNLPGKPVALIPPKPLVLNVQASPMTTINWPHKELNEEEILLAGAIDEEETQETAPQELELNIDSVHDEDQDRNAPKDFGFDKDIMSPLEEGNWGVDDIVDLPDIDDLDQHSANQQISSLADSAPGRDPLVERARNSQLAGELATCGDFEGAASILRRQIGVRDAAAFTPVFNKIFQSSRVKISGLPFVNPVAIQMSEDGQKLQVLGSTSQLMNILRVGYKQTSDGKFTEALTSFREILLQIPLLVLQNPQEEQDIYTLINICYNYIVALRCEISRRQNQDNPKRSLELSAYMCCCIMEPAHRVLVLRNAMALAYKQQDFIYAAYFAKRILQIAETNPNVIKSDKLDNARKVYAACEQKGTNQHTIEFDQNWLYENDAVTKICAKSLTPIKGNQVKRDAYIKASYKPEYDGQVDDIAGVCVIGAECLGLKLY